jgi:hypothetical protein
MRAEKLWEEVSEEERKKFIDFEEFFYKVVDAQHGGTMPTDSFSPALRDIYESRL